MVKLSDFLDLIDNTRESEEMINIMNCNGQKEVRAMLCSEIWDLIGDRTVNSVQAAGEDEFNIWLDD